MPSKVDELRPSLRLPTSDLAADSGPVDLGRRQLSGLFEQAPGIMAILIGRQHRIELVNPGYQQLAGPREVLGLSAAEAMPDAFTQGFVPLLDQAYDNGQVLNAPGLLFAAQRSTGAPTEDRYIDFVLQPIRNDDGEVKGIFVQGTDATERVQSDRRRDALVELTNVFRDVTEVGELSFALGAF